MKHLIDNYVVVFIDITKNEILERVKRINCMY